MTTQRREPIMAQTGEASAELVRVPLSDCPAVPIFLTNSAMEDWLAAHGVKVKPDHAGRPSIDLVTAYRLQAEAVAQAEAEQAQRQAAAERLTEEVDKAQRKRQELYEKTYLANLPPNGAAASTIALGEARQAAWKAIQKAERWLDPAVAQRLGPVSLDGLPGHPGFHMMNITILPPD